MARPEIPDSEKSRVETIYEQHRGYPAKSFQEALSTVADLAERAINESKEVDELPFQYEVEDSSTGIELRLSPQPNSNITKTDHGIETSQAVINSEKVFEELNQVDGVNRAHSMTSDDIQVSLEDNSERSFGEIVDDVFSTLSEIIRHEENKIDQIEQRSDQYASRKDSTDQ